MVELIPQAPHSDQHVTPPENPPTEMDTTDLDEQRGKTKHPKAMEKPAQSHEAHSSPSPSMQLLGIGTNGDKSIDATPNRTTLSDNNSHKSEPAKMMITQQMPAHPLFKCTGTEKDGKVALCPITQTTVEKIGAFFGYDTPQGSEMLIATTTADIAKVLAVLESTSFHISSKLQMIREDGDMEISTSTWSRAFQFTSQNCQHVEDFLRLTLDGWNHFYFTYEDKATAPDHQLREALDKSPTARPFRFLGQDLLLLPNLYLFAKIQQIHFQFANKEKYENHLEATIPAIMKKKYKNVIVMLPYDLRLDQLNESLKRLQQVAELTGTFLVLLPPLMLGSPEDWFSKYESIFQTWRDLQEDCAAQRKVIRVFLHGPALDAPIQLDQSWNILGCQLRKTRPEEPFDIHYLTCYFDKLQEELKNNGIYGGLTIQHKKPNKRPGPSTPPPTKRHKIEETYQTQEGFRHPHQRYPQSSSRRHYGHENNKMSHFRHPGYNHQKSNSFPREDTRLRRRGM